MIIILFTDILAEPYHLGNVEKSPLPIPLARIAKPLLIHRLTVTLPAPLLALRISRMRARHTIPEGEEFNSTVRAHRIYMAAVRQQAYLTCPSVPTLQSPLSELS